MRRLIILVLGGGFRFRIVVFYRFQVKAIGEVGNAIVVGVAVATVGRRNDLAISLLHILHGIFGVRTFKDAAVVAVDIQIGFRNLDLDLALSVGDKASNVGGRDGRRSIGRGRVIGGGGGGVCRSGSDSFLRLLDCGGDDLLIN